MQLHNCDRLVEDSALTNVLNPNPLYTRALSNDKTCVRTHYSMYKMWAQNTNSSFFIGLFLSLGNIIVLETFRETDWYRHDLINIVLPGENNFDTTRVYLGLRKRSSLGLPFHQLNHCWRGRPFGCVGCMNKQTRPVRIEAFNAIPRVSVSATPLPFEKPLQQLSEGFAYLRFSNNVYYLHIISNLEINILSKDLFTLPVVKCVTEE